MSGGWNRYAEEFNKLSSFDNHNIHTGLGLKGLDPSNVVGVANSILDVGCGEGTNTYLMYSVKKCKTIGIDIALSAIEKASKQYATDTCVFFNCDLSTYIKEYDGTFDLITFWGSLDYIELDDNFFREITKITNIGSRCFISKFHPMWTTIFENDVEEQNMHSYFENGRIDLIPYGNINKVFLERIHYNISYIYRIFYDNGWALKTMQEPKPNIIESSFRYENYDLDDILMTRMKNIPMTIIFEFERRK